MKFKIKNTPSTLFYKEFYILLEEFLKGLDFGQKKGTDIIIKNVIGDDEYLQKDYSVLGFITYRKKKINEVKYTIDFAELSSLNFKDIDRYNSCDKRVKNFIDNLGLKFCPETVAVQVLLHEFGHIESSEMFRKYTENDLSSYISYSRAVEGLYTAIMRPWELANNIVIDQLNIMFNSVETYAELFSFKHFPYFIKFLKSYGFGI